MATDTNHGPKKVDAWLTRLEAWRPEAEALRKILRSTELSEHYKWRQPVYAIDDDRNVLIIAVRKATCGIGFFKGVLLDDPDKMLDVPGPNSQSVRDLRFTSLDEIAEHEATIRRFVAEAIAHERAGTEVPMPAKDDVELSPELLDAFTDDPELEAAFLDLTPGRQRSWIMHIDQAKQAATRVRRIAKAREKIMLGKGQSEY